MSTITREQLRARAREKVKSLEFSITQTAFADSRAELEEELELARIALASLEAGTYGYVHKAAYEQAGSCGLSGDHEAYRDSSTHIAVYTAPPALVSVPDAYVRDERGRMMLNGRQEPRIGYGAGWNGYRAAMLQGVDGTLTNEGTKRVGELAMWVKRLAHSLRKANPDSKLQSDAMDYLSRKGLIGVKDILR